MNKNQSLYLACLLSGVLGGPGVWAASTNAIAASANAKPDSASANAAPANVKAASTGNAKAAPTGNAKAAPTGNAKAASTDGQFDQLVDDFVLGTLALSPTAATGFGYHVHHGASLDDMLDDFSPAGIAASRSLSRDIEARIARLDTASLDAEQRADIDVMHNALGASRLELDEIQSYRHNPTSYVELLGNGLYSPYMLQYAP